MDIEKRIDNIVMNRNVLEIGGLGDFENYERNAFQNWRHLRIKKMQSMLKE